MAIHVERIDAPVVEPTATPTEDLRVPQALRPLFRGVARKVLAIAVVSLTLVTFHAVRADERTDYLVRLLQTSTAFRVRAQAAISLGSVPSEPSVIQALTAALADENPAVRAAAASSLGRLGNPSALTALRALERDPEAAVRTAAAEAVAALQRAGSRSTTATASGSSRSTTAGTTATPPAGPARYYVGIGVPGSRVASVDPAVLRSARSFIERSLASMGGVVVAPEAESVAAANRVLRERSLAGFYLDSSVTVLEQRPDGALRASVSVVVQDYPGRNVRSMLTGSATVSGETGTAAQRTAIEAALGSALRNLATAMAAASGPRR
ncbi:MAG: hypothetical protein OHK0013_35180 [Sandaracinaceae bacterium]